MRLSNPSTSLHSLQQSVMASVNTSSPGFSPKSLHNSLSWGSKVRAFAVYGVITTVEAEEWREANRRGREEYDTGSPKLHASVYRLKYHTTKPR